MDTLLAKAIRKFNAGMRPQNYGQPRSYFLRDLVTSKIYPLKIIWALARGIPSRRYKSNTIAVMVRDRTRRFEIIHLT